MNKLMMTIAAGVACAFGAFGGETVFYAAPDGTGSGDSPDDPADLLTAFSKCGNGTGWDKATKNYRKIVLAAGDYDFSKTVREDTSTVLNLMTINKDKNRYIWFQGAVNADGSPASRIIGGGPELNMRLLYAENASSAFRMESLCVTNFGCSTDQGGALYLAVSDGYGCYITNCEFRCCTATLAGAVRGNAKIPAYNSKFIGNRFTSVTTSTGKMGGSAAYFLTCRDCLFEDNGHEEPEKANKYHGGAAIDCDCYGCVFVGNKANYSAAFATVAQSCCAVDCVFSNNTAYGINIVAGVKSITLDNCEFYGNTAASSSAVVYDSDLKNCRLISNSAGRIVQSGKASNCLFFKNTSTLNDVCSCLPVNCLFMSNVSALRVVDSSSVKNSVFQGNVKPSGALVTTALGSTIIEASVANGNSEEVLACFTYDADGVPVGILRNKASKKLLIDKGIDVGWTADDRDLAGNVRVFNDIVDIGCFEWPGPFPGLMLLVW